MLKTIALVALIIPAVVFTTYQEWQHLEFLNFSDEESKLYVAQLGDRIPSIPDNFGDWSFAAEDAMDPAQISAAKITKYHSRSYRNKVTGAEVTILLSTGPRAEICIHTPAQCYPNAGNVPVNEEEVQDVHQINEAGEPLNLLGSFVWQRYRNNQNQDTEIWWSFNESGKWEGTKNPRMTFTKPGIYKLYVIKKKNGVSEGKKSESPQLSFIRAFIPALNKQLFPSEDVKDNKVAIK
jgi:hypothetical protein